MNIDNLYDLTVESNTLEDKLAKGTAEVLAVSISKGDICTLKQLLGTISGQDIKLEKVIRHIIKTIDLGVV